MVPQDGTHPPSQDLPPPAWDPVWKLLAQSSGKEGFMDPGVLMPPPAFGDISDPRVSRPKGSSEALS